MVSKQEKQILRSKWRDWRKTFQRSSGLDTEICSHLQDLIEGWGLDSPRIFAYCALKGEPDTSQLWQNHLFDCALPRLDNRVVGKMDFFHHPAGSRLLRSEIGILEPEAYGTPLVPSSQDVVLVPGLTFDQRGSRLGFGGGYYDRYFQRFGGGVWVGVGYAATLSQRPLPREPHDLRVGFFVSEQGVTKTGDTHQG